MRKINIAIDGHSACGKSTTAKQVATVLGYTYIDTGAMYRAVTLYFLKNGIDFKDDHAVKEAIDSMDITFEWVIPNEPAHTFLNGKDVEAEIRAPFVAEKVSEVSTISAVRKFLVAQQQKMGMHKGVVMDGRDIGTVVFPDAELKVFMTADPDIRAKRRQDELKAKGIDQPLDEVKKNLLSRDHIDSTRSDSPLKLAEDAIVIDTSYLSMNEQAEKVLTLAYKLMEH
jgi:cytidylate kinase